MTRDKIYHIIAGAFVALIFTLFHAPGFVTWFAVFVVALGKEYIYDARVKGHTVDIMDAVATIAGGSVSMWFA
ncbi:hypothetical protein KAR91_41320 [Candidatus Pacearchaeota archaeon]|nr:hypothetical protein [Candidatus Pacearchaeota archaeon]